MWKQYGTTRQATYNNILRRMRSVIHLTKATDTYQEYVILIAFPQRQWLRERASLLRYTTFPVLLLLATFILTLRPFYPIKNFPVCID
jgi:hypothetical protein